MTAKSAMIQSVFTTAVRVDDTRLRRQAVDILPKLLALMEAEEKKLPVLIEG